MSKIPGFDRKVVTAIFGGLLGFAALVAVQGILAAQGNNLLNVDFSASALFGDSFGPISALMASIAAIGAWSAVRLQHRELEEMRERAVDDRVEQDARDFKAQYFGLLENFDNLVISIHSAGGGYSGRPALTTLRMEIRHLLVSEKEKDRERIYLDWFGRHADELAHYFRFLYHIVIYIDVNSHNGTQDMLFVRAKLSESELVLIALNATYGEGKEKFARLIEKYHLLHNMTEESRVEMGFDGHFSARAFEPGMSGKFLGQKMEQQVIRCGGLGMLYDANKETEETTYRDRVADHSDLIQGFMSGRIDLQTASEAMRLRKEATSSNDKIRDDK